MNRRSIAAWTAGYFALAMVLTFPLVFHLSSTVTHDLGDPLLSVSILWWNAHVLPLTARWWDGFAFYPAHGFLAYSDHRLGESLLATPLQWVGCSPIAAYNLTLLATFPLCAIVAHWLGFTLTKRHDAAALCGLAYGFNPYRVAHLPHLELLAAFGMPAALAALHQYMDTRHRAWLAAFALALVLQGLCTSYYLLFFSVLLGLWIVWFLRWTDARLIGGVMIAAGAAAVLLAPLAMGYLRIHSFYGFSRSLGDIVTFSADLTSLVTAPPLSLLWGWMARPDAPEGELFPGLTIVLLAIAGGAIALRARPVTHDPIDRVSIWFAIAAALLTVIAVCGWAVGPWRVDFAVVTARSESAYKTMSLALVAAVAAAARSSRARDAYSRRSTLAFYLLATAVMLLCAFGPKPSFRHHQILYEPPYAWLMRLPLFGSIRAPARFGMLAMLTLSVSGALAFSRLRVEGSTRTMIAFALMSGIVADGSMRRLPLPAVPDLLPAGRAAGFAAVIELPLGDVYDDMAAMYRATDHGRPLVNGNSGFEAVHYPALAIALRERDPSALEPIIAKGPLLAVVHKPMDQNGSWQRYLLTIPGVTPLDDDEGHFYFAAAPKPPAKPACTGDRLDAAAVTDNRGVVDLGALTDGDPETFWETPTPAHAGERLVVDLGRLMRPCAVDLGVGPSQTAYARKLSVDVSGDAAVWTTVTTARTAGSMVRALLEKPRGASITIAFAAATARFVRVSVIEASETDPWMVSEITVIGARQPE